MAENSGPERDGGRPTIDAQIPNPIAMGQAMADIAARSQRLVAEFLQRQAAQFGKARNFDPLTVGNAFMEMTSRLMADPARLMQAQMSLWNDHLALWQRATQRWLGQEVEPVIEPAQDDRRFRDPAWDENHIFDFIKQSYLLTARWMQWTIRDVDGLDGEAAQKVEFYTRQFVDALAPSNFVMTNPEVLRTTFETGGENLLRGLENLLSDLEKGGGRLQFGKLPDDAFTVGRDLAATPGKVIYQNDLMQLLQYAPSTTDVARHPLLIVPPWVNKYYILDLRPRNSFIKWAVDQGHTVFLTSWVNPDDPHSEASFDDYLLRGPMAALDAIEQATGEREVNVVGYSLGGTLLAIALAYMAAKGDDRPKSATYLATMTDFAEPGELGVFIDEEQLCRMRRANTEPQSVNGSEVAATFSMLRANDLIWSFVVNNYLLGKDTFPLDLLHWNGDTMRVPTAMHSFYLRNLYQDNKLPQPGGIAVDGVPIDLGKITVPGFMVSTKEDHIAPWKSTYALTQMTGGKMRFCLGASGHVTGIVNPPSDDKYCYWTSEKTPDDADAWLLLADKTDGSWWPEWQSWISTLDGTASVPARPPGGGQLDPIEDAPGSYVKKRAA